MKVIKKSFEEAQYMASIAVSGGTARINRKAWWEAGMLALREAYRK